MPVDSTTLTASALGAAVRQICFSIAASKPRRESPLFSQSNLVRRANLVETAASSVPGMINPGKNKKTRAVCSGRCTALKGPPASFVPSTSIATQKSKCLLLCG